MDWSSQTFFKAERFWHSAEQAAQLQNTDTCQEWWREQRPSDCQLQRRLFAKVHQSDNGEEEEQGVVARLSAMSFGDVLSEHWTKTRTGELINLVWFRTPLTHSSWPCKCPSCHMCQKISFRLPATFGCSNGMARWHNGGLGAVHH